MDSRIRISDADRDRIIGRLNHHFAEGRITQEELDERVTATLNAKTFADIRTVLADLPEPAFVPAGAEGAQPTGPPPWAGRRRGPRVLPLAVLALVLVVFVMPGGLVFAILKALIIVWLLALLAGIFAVGRLRRRMRGQWWMGRMYGGYWGAMGRGYPGYPRRGHRGYIGRGCQGRYFR